MDVDDGLLTRTEFAAEDGLGEDVLDVLLDHALEGAGAELGVVAEVGEALGGGGRELELDAALGQLSAQPCLPAWRSPLGLGLAATLSLSLPRMPADPLACS